MVTSARCFTLSICSANLYLACCRNGGHIKPPLHHDYLNMKKKFGFEQARKLMRFRLMHIDELLRVATSEQILNECQCRAVESMDVYFDHVMFQEAKEQLVAWKNDMPNESAGFYWVDGKKAAEVSSYTSETINRVLISRIHSVFILHQMWLV